MKRDPKQLFADLKLWSDAHKKIAYPIGIGAALLIIFLIYRIIVTRLLNFNFAYEFDFSVFLKQRLTDESTYFNLLIWGFWTTVRISAISIVLAMALGTVIAVLKLTRVKVLVFLSSAYIEFFRNTPLLIQIFIWYFGSDPFLPTAVKDWIYSRNIEFAYGVIALSTYTAAFIAEEIRAGIQSIPREQMEAARSQGFTFLESMRYVILPQAFRIVIPPLINQSLNLVKNSSLVMAIGVVELTHAARIIEAETSRVCEAFSMVTLIYLAMSLVISFAINQYNRRFLRYIKY